MRSAHKMFTEVFRAISPGMSRHLDIPDIFMQFVEHQFPFECINSWFYNDKSDWQRQSDKKRTVVNYVSWWF